MSTYGHLIQIPPQNARSVVNTPRSPYHITSIRRWFVEYILQLFHAPRRPRYAKDTFYCCCFLLQEQSAFGDDYGDIPAFRTQMQDVRGQHCVKGTLSLDLEGCLVVAAFMLDRHLFVHKKANDVPINLINAIRSNH